MSIYISGIGVSRGIAIGKAFVLAREQHEAIQITLPASEVKDEIKRFKQALKLANKQLHEIKEKIANIQGSTDGAVKGINGITEVVNSMYQNAVPYLVDPCATTSGIGGVIAGVSSMKREISLGILAPTIFCCPTATTTAFIPHCSGRHS